MKIGDFLRSVRSRLSPEALGLPSSGQRRVAGLRREEVAVLAGISVDYYTRLEQGREQHPSHQIIESLARGLNLSGDEREHLFRLAGYSPPAGTAADKVKPELARQMGRWRDQAAFVLSGTLDILAPNPLAQALFHSFTEKDNLARMIFLDPAARTFYRQWDYAADSTVAALRHNSTRVPETIFTPVIRDLAEASDEFRLLWERQQVRGKTHAAKHLHHSGVGDLTLEYLAFDIPEAPGQQLIVYDAEPGTNSAQAFSMLQAYSPAHHAL
ncbi:helix-turn-helix transcriptional regulator [Nesterenkonia haasae]|uniref:helix-turn-helix transcriptional regulator n=1 Tax=Nesterenkonia haasae TaxID=2587813 RepID=UPI001391C656|nr:helix-turn-helix transcriptional regulator [Nesterenkonia haasae]NDK31792.1 helix-turn-helix domain-containing protein [Nesterenkonia haasae]